MQTKDWIDLAVAVGTAMLALGTFCLAKFTQTAVANAGEGLRQADRHHQESSRPFCVIEFEKNANTKDQFGKEFAPLTSVVTDGGGPFPGKLYISIRGRLLNKGLGPAKDVVVYLNRGSSVDEKGNEIDGRSCWLTHPVAVCGIIGAGEAIDIDVSISEQNVASVVAGGRRVPTNGVEWIAQDAYEAVLRYRDVFDNVFRTVHAKGFPQNIPIEAAVASGNKLLEAQQSIRPNRPMPVFLKGEQPWRTLADIPQPPIGMARGC